MNRNEPTPNTTSESEQTSNKSTPEYKINEASKISKKICLNINNLPQKVTNTPEILTKLLYLSFCDNRFTNVKDRLLYNPDKVYTLYELDEYSLEYRMISNFFMETNKKFYVIQKIQKMFNPFLLMQYKLKYLEYLAKNKIMTEKQMFHGTLKSNLDNICRNNFNWRLHGRNLGVKNGRGVNFTSDAYFATHYSDTGFDKVMIIANVLIGKSCRGSPTISVPPSDFDTTIDHREPPQVYVKYDDNTFYPAYIVYYGGIDSRHRAQRIII